MLTKIMMRHEPNRVLVLGANGMLGNAVFRLLASSARYEVFGTTRSLVSTNLLPKEFHSNIFTGVEAENVDALMRSLVEIRPDIVINCVGLVKQLNEADQPLSAIPINSLFPHRLAGLCQLAGARLIHMGTDCVFSGERGSYTETDRADARDLYGRTKFLGEVDYPHAITLRTSLIGIERGSARSLIGWFLAQTGRVRGYKRAIFSGLPTVEVARVIRDHVIPHPELHGVYHLSGKAINKYDLLKIVAEAFDKTVDLVEDNELIIDRSLDSTRLQQATGFVSRPWPDLLREMREFG